MNEKRKPGFSKASPLPVDYAKLVTGVFAVNFEPGLKKLKTLNLGDFHFGVFGGVFLDEIVISVSLLKEDQLTATTVHASVDFDPQASAPNAQDLLALCVDAVGAVYADLLTPENPKRLAQAVDASLSALENIPFEWAEMKVDRFKIFVKVDKSNPKIDSLTEEWLAKNDPDFHRKIEADQRETEKLFVTGPKRPPNESD